MLTRSRSCSAVFRGDQRLSEGADGVQQMSLTVLHDRQQEVALGPVVGRLEPVPSIGDVLLQCDETQCAVVARRRLVGSEAGLGTSASVRDVLVKHRLQKLNDVTDELGAVQTTDQTEREATTRPVAGLREPRLHACDPRGENA